MPGSGVPSPSQALLRAAARVYADDTIPYLRSDFWELCTFSNPFFVFDLVLDGLDEDPDPILSHKIGCATLALVQHHRTGLSKALGLPSRSTTAFFRHVRGSTARFPVR
jgi:hypothetical protein